MSNILIEMYRTRFLTMINYCYVIINTETQSAIFVDPSWKKRLFVDILEQRNLTLSGILLTHHHFDHVHLAGRLAKRYQAPVFMSASEIDMYGFKCPNLTSITDFQSFELNGIPVLPYLTPGHTCGSVCWSIGNSLFTGDTLFIEGCGMCWGRGADPGDMFDSLQMLKKTLSADTLICPGHSYGCNLMQPFAAVKEKNVYLQFNDRENFINYRMRRGQVGLFSFK